MASPPYTLPNFLIIGAQRCATRWLRTNLIEHPDVFMPPFDVGYFDHGNRIRRGGETWYRNQFVAWEHEPHVGESTPGYLMPSSRPLEVAARMHELIPDVRLIALVRQPVDRMYSAMFHEIRRGRLPADSDLFAMVADGHPDVEALDLVSAGLYGQNLYPFWKRFGEQLLVVLQDDVRTQPEKVYETVLRHIGASPDFVPSHLDTVLFSNRRTVRFSGPRPTHDDLCRLYNLYRDDVAELEAMFGMDLSRWDPGPPGPAMSDAPPELPPLPSFIIIGAQKCATRWLRSNLGEHPSIWAVENELSYFDSDRRYALGPEFYRAQFAGWTGQPLLGESTPGYLMPRNHPAEVARRIGETVPDVRLLAVIRNPVDRAQSALIHHIRYGRVRPSTDLVEYVRSHPDETDPLGVVAGGRYAAGLEAFRSRFGEQLLVVLHDDIRTDPGGVFDAAARHVGAEAGFVPSGLAEVRFSNRSTTGEVVAGETTLSADDRAELYGYFREDLDRLGQLLGVDLSAWAPAA